MFTEFLLTMGTLEWFFSSVNPDMSLQGTLLPETTGAVLAGIGQVVGVGTQMNFVGILENKRNYVIR